MSRALIVPEPAVSEGIGDNQVEALVFELGLGPGRRVVEREAD